MKPLLKWVGGKQRLLNELIARMPSSNSFDIYFEPFFGGGAFFFGCSILHQKMAFLSDINAELINFYSVVRSHPDKLWQLIEKTPKITATRFYDLREEDRKEGFLKRDSIYRAWRFLVINKTCYNGVYRENLKGQCNSPYGKYLAPVFAQKNHLKECTKLLASTRIYCMNFSLIELLINEYCFVYLDPPYLPLNSDSFTDYSKGGFKIKQHQELKSFCDRITQKGAKFMLSNSLTDVTSKLYKDYRIDTIEAPRSVSCKGSDRKPVQEVIIRNYGD